MIGEAARVPVRVVPPLLETQVAVYAVIAAPPLLIGARKLTVAVLPDTDAVGDRGGLGVLRGIALTVADHGLIPALLRAVTRK